MPDLSPQLTQAATDPAAFTSDGQTAQAQDPAKLILLDQYLAAKNRASPFRQYQITLPSQVSGAPVDPTSCCGGS